MKPRPLRPAPPSGHRRADPEALRARLSAELGDTLGDMSGPDDDAADVDAALRDLAAAGLPADELDEAPDAEEPLTPGDVAERAAAALGEADPASGLRFDSLGLDARLLSAVSGLGFVAATPIQAAAVPPLLAGHDLIGRARTGSGKTAAFGLPLLEKVKAGGKVKALVLAPTRELALQVTEALRGLAADLPVRVAAIYGGAPYPPQLKALESGVTVVVGTPGRLIDHLERGSLSLAGLELLVLDEADEMLRMGFIDEVEQIFAAAPDSCQVALFSATMPPPIRRIADAYLSAPVEIQVEDKALTTSHITQTWACVPQEHKLEALSRVLRADPSRSTLVFARTRSGCAEVADALAKEGIAVDALHGDLNQSARERVLARMRSGRLGVVVATDVAARGLDVEHIELVINLDMPGDTETYVHRIGRTGRAGRAGRALSFLRPAERPRIRQMERLLDVKLEEITPPSDRAIALAQRAQLRAAVEAVPAEALEPAKALLTAWQAETGKALEELAAALLAAKAEAERVPLGALPSDQPPHWARPIRKERPTRPQERPQGRFDRFDRGQDAGPGRFDRGQDAGPGRFDRGQDAGPGRFDRGPDASRADRPAGRPERPTAPHADRPWADAPEERPWAAAAKAPREERRGPPGEPQIVELFFPVGLNRNLRPADFVGAIANECRVPGHLIGRVTLLERKTFVAVPADVARHVLATTRSLWLRGGDVPVALARPPGFAHEGGAPTSEGPPPRPRPGFPRPQRR